MKRRGAITRLVILGVVAIIGIVFAVVPMQFGLTDYKSFVGGIQLGIDLKGGMYAVYEIDENEDTANITERLAGTAERIKALLADKGGYTEATIVTENDTRIRVEVPNVDNPQQILDIIGEPASMSFVLEGSEIINGDHVVNAASQMATDGTGTYAVRLELNSEGARRFYEATSEANRGKRMSIYINETEIASPEINDPIPGGVALITGSFTKADADSLAGKILSGAMEVKLNLVESDTVSATLGEEALMLGLIAGGIGLLLVMLFLIGIYRGLGMAASFAFVIYTVLLLFLLSVLPWVQLTLPGIAGVILSLGMAVDANVIMFERIKDEYRSGKSISSSVHAGFKRGLPSIIDANVTTVIAAIVLWILGSGPVKGFAITLFIGVILSMITAVFVTRFILNAMLRLNKVNNKFYGLNRDENIEELPDEPERPKRKPFEVEGEPAHA